MSQMKSMFESEISEVRSEISEVRLEITQVKSAIEEARSEMNGYWASSVSMLGFICEYCEHSERSSVSNMGI